MTSRISFIHRLARHPALAVVCYAGVVFALAFTTWAAVADIQQRQAEIAAANDLLAQMDGRKTATGDPAAPAGQIPTGSPFLEGQTVTVAGAAILQRVASAVRRYGGKGLSSPGGVGGAQTKDGPGGGTASWGADQPAVQRP